MKLGIASIFGKSKAVVPTLEVFLNNKRELEEEEVTLVLNKSNGDFSIISNNPKYSNGKYPEQRDLVVQYNGVHLELSGYEENNKLYLSSPIQKLMAVAKL